MICDLAETYHIYDFTGLSPDLVATFVVGLRDNSRVKMKMTETKLTVEQILLAIIADCLQFIAWTKTKESRKGKYKQKSILKTLQGTEKKKDDLISFASVEEFESYMSQFDK